MDTPLTGSRAGNSITPSKKVSFSEICSTHFANFIFADEGVATKSTTMHFIYRFESAGTEQYFVILRKKVEQGTKIRFQSDANIQFVFLKINNTFRDFFLNVMLQLRPSVKI